MEVIKRDGSIVEFNKHKIREAILKAMKHGSGIYLPDIAKLIANDAENYFKDENETPTIYKIESYVYERLVHYGQSITAKSYEGYRAVQSFKRNINTTDESILGLIQKTNEDVLKENSNKNWCEQWFNAKRYLAKIWWKAYCKRNGRKWAKTYKNLRRFGFL